jgi:hypothetical protein
MEAPMSQYRDGVFSVSAPAPRYGSLTTVFENGSLGGLEEDAAAALDPVLDEFAVQMAVTVSPIGRGGRGGAAALSGGAAVNLAKDARAATDINSKLALAIAAGYAASHFGLPENTVLVTVAGICDTFAMTSNQRTALHQQAMALYKSAIVQQQDLQRRSEALLEKGNAMSGVFRDGVLGSAFRDGVLGHTYQDGVLGALSPMQRMAGGRPVPTYYFRPTTRPVVRQQRQVSDGSLGATYALTRPSAVPAVRQLNPLLARYFYGTRSRARKQRAVQGLGCGCAGVGEDAPAAETPIYKKPLVIGGAAVALGVVFYALSRK